MPSTAYIALGANVGPCLESFRQAMAILEQDHAVQLQACSSLYETSPVGGPSPQHNYLNAVVAVRTGMSPGQLLAALKGIERRLGRRGGIKDGPRTLDLDLLLFEDRVIDEPDLQVPHPRLHLRRFVLQPLCDLAAELVHPRLGRSVGDLLAGVASNHESVQCRSGPEWLCRRAENSPQAST